MVWRYLYLPLPISVTTNDGWFSPYEWIPWKWLSEGRCASSLSCARTGFESGCKWEGSANYLSRVNARGDSSTAARLGVHTVKGRVFPEHLRTADWATSIINVWRCRHLNHSGAPEGVAVEAVVTSGSSFSFPSNLRVAVKLWSLHEADKWWELLESWSISVWFILPREQQKNN